MGWFTPAEQAILRRRVVKLSTMAELRFASKTSRVWNGDRWLKFGGHLWQPLYGAGIIDGIPVMTTTAVESITLSLPGINSSIMGLALAGGNEAYQRPMLLHWLFRGEDWQPLFSKVVFYGFMQPPAVSDRDGMRVISVECLNAMFNRSRPSYGRFNDADQQARYPGDKFFSFQASMTQKRVRGYP